MSLAFEVTEDDLDTVIRRHLHAIVNSQGVNVDGLVQLWWADLDIDAIEAAALAADLSGAGDDLEEELSLQTDAAHHEIHRQLVEAGRLKP